MMKENTGPKTLEVSLDMPRPASGVWRIIGDFASLSHWSPGVSECRIRETGQGRERRVTLSDGNEVLERLEAANDAEYWYRYRVLEAPGLPVGTDFVATLAVYPEGTESCRVRWSAEFRLPDSLPERYERMTEEQVIAMYETSLAFLRTRLARDASDGE